jgi:hypothetical protein
MDRFEASLRETQETLQALQRAKTEDRAILDRLCEHLMGPLDVRDYDIRSSSFGRGQGSPRERGSPSARGSPSTRGSLSVKGTPVRASVELTLRRRPRS